MNPRHRFDALTEICEEYTNRPWDGTMSHLAETVARQAEVRDILEAHADWLRAVRSRVEVSGQRWNTASCRWQSRLDGDLTVPPEWLAEQFERGTPNDRMNR
ncbi:MAG TPA: hypothetical protein DIW80_19475 [Gordonia polyisoprenivorans]|uniref:hypothetical protein n=1 Tax=uncultured Gordonia sp. TaxID=198437 RepID=UPI000EEB58CB|nr:hypothetical protein [uncultured Gordonia sp.]HCS59065.1 hypothetical protein [Gordonia polyisoprenivorans]